MTEISEMRKLAVEAAKGAGAIAMKYFKKDKEEEEKEKNELNYVTRADIESEKLIVDAIKEKFPDHRIISEEAGEIKSDSDYEWLIDPLDGTNNYVLGIPYFSVSIAATYKEELIFGVIYVPMTEMLLTAEKGEGAFLNGKKISVSKTKEMKDAVIGLGFDRSNVKKLDKWENAKNSVLEIIDIAKDIRRTGSCVTDLSYVAFGKSDARIHFGVLTPWDTPAGTIIIREAGGKVTDFDGNEPRKGATGLIASNSFIHEELFNMIKKHW